MNSRVIIQLTNYLSNIPNNLISPGTPILRLPSRDKVPLDLFKFYELVVCRGGLLNVIKNRLWPDIIEELDVPRVSNAGHRLCSK